MTAEHLAHLLTLELRCRGERRILKCHEDVSEALRLVIPPPEPKPCEPPDWYAAGMVGDGVAMRLGDRNTRRLADETGLPVVRAIVRGGSHTIRFVTAGGTHNGK